MKLKNGEVIECDNKNRDFCDNCCYVHPYCNIKPLRTPEQARKVLYVWTGIALFCAAVWYFIYEILGGSWL